MILKNFKQYEPTNENKIMSIQYFISDEGVDFYDSFDRFTLKYKLGFDSQGIIRTISEDISAIYPLGLSIVDVDVLPYGLDIDGNWVYLDGCIKKYEQTHDELNALANYKKQVLLAEAANVIAPLQDAVELNTATKEEIKLLAEWKEYRIMINRAEASSVSEIPMPRLL